MQAQRITVVQISMSETETAVMARIMGRTTQEGNPEERAVAIEWLGVTEQAGIPDQPFSGKGMSTLPPRKDQGI